MYKAEINGATVEAEDLKTLTKLLKKEERRQEKERVTREERRARANLFAFASYGRIVYQLANNTRFYFRKPIGADFQTVSDYTYGVRIDSLHSSAYMEFSAKYYEVSAILELTNGETLALRSFDKNSGDVTWFAVGAYEGEPGYQYLDPETNTKLESHYQNTLKGNENV